MSSIKKPRVIIVEGCIGSGKSTIIPLLQDQLMKRGLKVAITPEPVHLWEQNGILSKFYEDMERWAETFQMMAYVTRINSILETVSKHPDIDVLILERSVLTDRFIFMELQRFTVGFEAMERYEWWANTFDRLLEPIDLKSATFLYLKPTVATCMEKMAKRGRVAEVKEDKKKDRGGSSSAGGVTQEYQQLLHQAHEALFQNLHLDKFPRVSDRPFKLSNVVVIESDLANQDYSSSAAPEERDKIINTILAKLGFSQGPTKVLDLPFVDSIRVPVAESTPPVFGRPQVFYAVHDVPKNILDLHSIEGARYKKER